MRKLHFVLLKPEKCDCFTEYVLVGAAELVVLGFVPDFNSGVHTQNNGFVLKLRGFSERLGNHNSSRGVRRNLRRRRSKGVLKRPRFVRRKLLDIRDNPLKLLPWHYLNARTVKALGDVEGISELFAELCRQDNSALGVYTVVRRS